MYCFSRYIDHWSISVEESQPQGQGLHWTIKKMNKTKAQPEQARWSTTHCHMDSIFFRPLTPSTVIQLYLVYTQGWLGEQSLFFRNTLPPPLLRCRGSRPCYYPLCHPSKVARSVESNLWTHPLQHLQKEEKDLILSQISHCLFSHCPDYHHQVSIAQDVTIALKSTLPIHQVLWLLGNEYFSKIITGSQNQVKTRSRIQMAQLCVTRWWSRL